MVLVLCCSATIRFSAIVVFLAGLPSGRGQAVWKIIDQKVKSGFSRRWSYPIFCLPTDVFYTSNTKAHLYIGCLLFDDSTFCGQVATLLNNHCNRPISEIGSLDISHTL